MTIEAELENLRRDVQELKDRAAILDCIATHARGCDRHDVALLSSTYHDDGIDEHGTATIPGPEYAAWANAAHAASSHNDFGRRENVQAKQVRAIKMKSAA